jgi:hypothetical protein
VNRVPRVNRTGDCIQNALNEHVGSSFSAYTTSVKLVRLGPTDLARMKYEETRPYHVALRTPIPGLVTRAMKVLMPIRCS